MSGGGAAGQSLSQLFERLGLVETRIRQSVARRRADDPAPDDPFRGLYLSEATVERYLANHGRVPPTAPANSGPAPDGEAGPAVTRLHSLIENFALSALDVDILLVTLAPDLDARFERFYGYLNDDVTRRRPTSGLVLELCGVLPGAAARARLRPGGPLVDGGLVLVEEPDRPFLTRSLRVPDRVTGFLLGDDTPDSALADLLRQPPSTGHDGGRLGRAVAGGVRLSFVRERPGGMGLAYAAAALASAGRRVLTVDLGLLAAADPATVAVLGREARLLGAGIVAGPVEAVSAHPAILRALAAQPVPLVLVGRCTWDPAWTAAVPLVVESPVVTSRDRVALWASALDGLDVEEADASAVTTQFLLSPEQVERAARTAVLSARLEGRPLVTADDLHRGARAQNEAGLEQLARRIEPAVGWDDLVLPEDTLAELHDLAARARHREKVLREWRMRPGGGRGCGVTALFAGDSGTGKTMSAEVIAADLGLDVYAINLAGVVDKYVGETEKNLERIFTAASGVNGVLLFDEAEAIFGKRSEVRDAHDRYANIESAYLLQRIESFDGLAVLATNLRANLDDAFTRRFDMVVDFAPPDGAQRKLLWERCLGTALPRDPSLDLDFCADAFELSGGNIRSVVVTAAYLAADAGQPVTMEHVIHGVHREYRKLGRLCLQSEFGRYHPLISPGRAHRRPQAAPAGPPTEPAG